MFLNDSNNKNNNKLLETQVKSHKLKILKSYYNKDVSESVSKSFLIKIDSTNKLTNSESLSSLSSSSYTSLSNSSSLNKKIETELKLNTLQETFLTISESNSSCTKFLDQLLINESKNSLLNNIKTSTLPIKSSNKSKKLKLIKRFSINKLINNNNNNSNTLTTQDLKMNQNNKQLFLLNKKLRKMLPFNLGLKNHGNTCFMNCVLQCLFHTSPLTDYFITNQYEHDIYVINTQKSQNLLNNKHLNNPNMPNYILTKHFNRLLASMWHNNYESSYSADLKDLIGYLNPTFAGLNQNDSHEFCVWLLDRLSQELSYRVNSNDDKMQTCSFFEELFKIEFKSSVVCSKCNYKSSKLETDMMLSLPLPSELNQNKPKSYVRRSLYLTIILNKQPSIKLFKHNSNSSSSSSSSPSSTSSLSSSKFYINSDLDDNSLPYSVKIGVNVHMSLDLGIEREVVNLSESSSTVIHPNFLDLKKYIQQAYNFNYDTSNLVFVDLNNFMLCTNDSKSIKETVFIRNEHLLKSSSSLCCLELNKNINLNSNQPIINIIAANIYNNNSYKIFFGLPFVLVINRDCTYNELCRKLFDSQAKYFKDKNVLKYRDLAEKFLRLSLITNVATKQSVRINPSDELPLYAELIDKALNESIKQTDNSIEHVKISIEWRSYEDLSNFFRELDPYNHIDYIHPTFRQLQKLDDTDDLNKSAYSNSTSNLNETKKQINLNDCFELFTQCEELTDDNSWTCTKCKKHSNAYKKLTISAVPPILIIHLKRFFYKSKSTNFKLTTPVLFPISGLDMSKYIDTDNDDDYLDSNNNSNSLLNSERYIYDLFAVCNHKGQNMQNGHYTAYCKNTIDTKWYCFDDSNCIQLSDLNSPNVIYNNGSANICTENAYILFYKRRNCMRNEKWWLKCIDRSLLDYNEFDYFIRNLDLIEKEQHQHNQQVYSIKSSGSNKPKTFREKVLGSNANLRSKSDVSIIDLNKDFYSYEAESGMKYYDEQNKPKRLIKKQDTSPSLASSKDLSTNTLSSNQTDSHDLINLNSDLNKINLNKKLDYLYNYPNDNEYIYKNTNQSDFMIPNQTPRLFHQAVYTTQNYPFQHPIIRPQFYNPYHQTFNSKIQSQPTTQNTNTNKNSNTSTTPSRYVNQNSIETSI